MKIDLKRKLGLNREAPFKILIDERLPAHIIEAVELTCSYEVIKTGRVLLLKLKQEGLIKAECQRCLGGFDSKYHLESDIAICSSDELATDVQETYDVIVAPDYQIDLKDILIDNLHLFSANLHDNIELCDRNQLKLMQNE